MVECGGGAGSDFLLRDEMSGQVKTLGPSGQDDEFSGQAVEGWAQYGGGAMRSRIKSDITGEVCGAGLDRLDRRVGLDSQGLYRRPPTNDSAPGQ